MLYERLFNHLVQTGWEWAINAYIDTENILLARNHAWLSRRLRMRRRLYLLLMAAMSIVLPLSFPDIAVQYFDMANDDEFIEVLAVLAVCCVFIARVHWYFVARMFDRRLGSMTRFKYLVASYLYTIAAFAGIYFLLVFIFDFVDADDDYNRYRFIALQATAEEQQYLIEYDLRIPAQKAFRGMHDELWTSVDSWELPANSKTLPVSPNLVPLASILDAACLPRSDVIRYRSDHRWTVYGDCLYLSSVTASTVGYGDISPANYFAKFFVSLEVIIGQMIMVIGLGTVFSNIYRAARWEKRTRH